MGASRFYRRLEIHAVDHCSRRCAHCSHAADLAPPRIYAAADYRPWLERLAAAGFAWEILALIGGEPFLHPDPPAFLDAIRPFGRLLEMWTNLTWLRSAADIDRHAATLARLDLLPVTFYADADRPAGRLAETRALLDAIRQRFPRLAVYSPGPDPTTEFAAVAFTADPRPIVEARCNFRGCLNLLDDGRLMRCCFVRRVLLGDAPFEPASIAEIVYDLRPPIDAAALSAWLAAPALDLCRYCSVAQGRLELRPFPEK
jgi:hypothetical protein